MPSFKNTDGAWLAMGVVALIGTVAAVAERGSKNHVRLVAVPWVDLDFGETWKPGAYGPSKTMTFKDGSGEHMVTLSAGMGDDITVFQDEGARASIVSPGYPIRTYLLAVNTGLPYVGLEVFEGDEAVGSVFLQEWEVEDRLGKRGADLNPRTIVQRLIPYLPY